MTDQISSFRGFNRDNETPEEVLDNRLSEIQAATEMVAETVEQKGNDVTEAVEDNTAANELVAENTESIRKASEDGNKEARRLNKFAQRIDKKLAKFSTMMENKFTGIASQGNTALQAVEDALKNPEESPAPESVQPDPLLPKIPERPDNENYPTLPKKDPRDEKDKKKKQLQNNRNSDMMVKLLKGGFKETISIANRISSTLFKMALTAAAEMAKWGAILLGLVIALDTVKIHLEYWSQLFQENFDKFLKEAGSWAAPITNLLSSFDKLRDYWVKGEYGKFIQAIVTGLGTALLDMAFRIGGFVASGIAAVLRALGFDDAGDTLEGFYLEQNRARGMQLNEREEEVMKRLRRKEADSISEEPETKVGQAWEATTDKGREALDWIKGKTFWDKDELDRQRERDLKQRGEIRAERKTHTDEQIDQSNDSANKLENKLIPLKATLDRLNPGDNDKLDVISRRLNDLKEQANNTDLVQSDRTAVNGLIEEMERVISEKRDQGMSIRSESPEKTEEAQQVNRTEAMQREIQNNNVTNNTANTVNTSTSITNNRTIRQGPPQTSTPAPGLLQSGVV